MSTSTPHFPSRRRAPRRKQPRPDSLRAQFIKFIDAHPEGSSCIQIADAFDLTVENVRSQLKPLLEKRLVARLKHRDGRVTWLPAGQAEGRAAS